MLLFISFKKKKNEWMNYEKCECTVRTNIKSERNVLNAI